MTNYKIFVKHKDEFFDAESERIKKDILALGLKKDISVKTAQIYEISGNIPFGKIKKICKNLLFDPITQLLFINFNPENSNNAIEIYYKSGVTDSVADTVKIGISDMGITDKLFIKTGKMYLLEGVLAKKEVKIIAEKILSNAVVQEYKIN